MRKGLTYILCFLLVASSSILHAQDLISFYDGTDLHLRWKGAQVKGLTGYVVYEKDGSSWKKLGQTSRLEKNKDLENTLGTKKGLFLQLAGVEDENADFTQARYDAVISNSEAYNFLGAMSVMNIEMAKALGEYIAVQPIGAGSSEIKVTTLVNGTEQDYVSGTIALSRQIVPMPQQPALSSKDASVELRWDEKANKEDWVVGFRVYRSDKALGPYDVLNPVGALNFGNTGNERSYLDRFLSNGNTYYYYITLYNALGVESERSEILIAQPVNASKAYPATSFGINEIHGLLKLSWSADSQRVSVWRSNERDGDFQLIFPPTEVMDFRGNYYVDRSAEEGAYYYYFIQTSSSDLKAKAYSDTISFALPDRTPPSAPVNVQGTVNKDGLASITWDENPEDDVLGYDVERFTGDSGINNYLLNPKLITTNSFSDNLGRRSQSAYRYVVYAVDHSYNRSAASEPIRLRRPDDIPPDRPIISYIDLDVSVLTLRWTKCMQEDFDHYTVYRREAEGDWKAVANLATAEFIDTLETEGMAEYCVTAVDGDGNESERSVSHKINHQPPHVIGPPSNGQAIDSMGGVMLVWEPSEDDRTVGYLIERWDEKGQFWQLIVDLKSNGDHFLDRGVTGKSSVQYRIRAYDPQWYDSDDLEITYEP